MQKTFELKDNLIWIWDYEGVGDSDGTTPFKRDLNIIMKMVPIHGYVHILIRVRLSTMMSKSVYLVLYILILNRNFKIPALLNIWQMSILAWREASFGGLPHQHEKVFSYGCCVLINNIEINNLACETPKETNASTRKTVQLWLSK